MAVSVTGSPSSEGFGDDTNTVVVGIAIAWGELPTASVEAGIDAIPANATTTATAWRARGRATSKDRRLNNSRIGGPSAAVVAIAVRGRATVLHGWVARITASGGREPLSWCVPGGIDIPPWS